MAVNNWKRLIALLLVLCMLTTHLASNIAFASTGDTPGIEATLYNTGDKQGAAVVLTEDGLDGNGDELTQVLSVGANLLHIDWTIDPSKENMLNISVPVGMYIETNWTAVEADPHLASVSFATLDIDSEQTGIQQGVATYYNAKTGTLTYTTKVENTAVDTIPIDVMLYFDQTLWDKYKDNSTGMDHNYLTPTEKVNNLTKEPPVTVSFTQKSGESETTQTKSIKNVTTNHEIGIVKGFSGNKYHFLASDEPRTTIKPYVGGGNNTSAFLKKFDVQYKVTILRKDENGRQQEIEPEWPKGFFIVDSNSLKEKGVKWNSETHTMSNVDSVITMDGSVFPQFLFSEEIVETVGMQGKDELKFTAIYTAETYTGTKLEGTTNVQGFVYEETIDTSIELYIRTMPIEGTDMFPEGTYDSREELLGILALDNFKGLADSDTIQVVVNFDDGYTGTGAPNMYVNSYNVPLAKGRSATVTAQVIKEDGTIEERTYDVTSTSDSIGPCIKTNTPKESFWTITYELVVPKGIKLYSGSRHDHSGVFFGRISKDLPVDIGVTASIEYSVFQDGNWIKAGSKELVYTRRPKTNKANEDSRLYIDTGKSNIQVTAGGTIYVKGRLETYNYKKNYNPHPVLFLALPTGIPTENITLKYTTDSGETEYATVTLSHTHTDNSGVQKNIYIIDLGKRGAYGGVTWSDIPDNNKWGTIASSQRPFELEIKTPTSMARGNYAINEHLFLTGKIPWLENDYFNVNYPMNKSFTYGVYDGDTAKHTFAIASGTNAFDILPLTTVMHYSTSVKLENDTDYSDSVAVAVPAATNYIYRVDMKNNDQSHVVPTINTALYIPVPHHKQKLPEYMGSDTLDTFEVRLTGPADIDEEQWLVGYSVDATSSNYYNNEATFENDNGTYATWYLTEEELTAAGYDWADVVCVKLILKEDFPVGGTDFMTMKLQIMPGDKTELMTYSSSSWEKYENGVEVAAGEGYASTNPITIQVAQNEIDLSDELRTDLQVETYTDIETGAGPQSQGTFDNYNGVPFYLASVTAHNLNLVSPSEIQSNIENNDLPEVAVQDSTFGLEIMLENDQGEGIWIDLTSLETAENVTIGDQTVKALLLGNSKVDDDNVIHVRLTNYENFVNMSKERYVEFKLYDFYDSLYLNFRVDVSRMLTATKPSTGIAAGELYNGIDGSTDVTVSILPDGAATASFQFIGYLPSNHTGGHTLTFSQEFPAGTTLILADFTDGGANYYHYKNIGEKTSISLTEFTGLNVGGYYVERTGSEIYDEHFVLIMDFTDTAGLTNNTNITMSVQNKVEAQPTAKTVTIQPLDALRYDFETYIYNSNNTLTSDDGFSFEFQHTFNCEESIQYRLADSQNNLRISLVADGISSFPLGTYAIYEGVKYWPEADGKYIIIPSSHSAYDDSHSSPIRIEMPYVQLENEEYSINVEWMCAAPNIKGVEQSIGGYRLPTEGNGNDDNKGDSNFGFSVENEIEKAILLGRDGGHLVSAEDICNGTATFNIKTQGIEVDNVTYVLYDKEGNVLSSNPVNGNKLSYADAKPEETYVLKASCDGVIDTYVFVMIE